MVTKIEKLKQFTNIQIRAEYNELLNIQRKINSGKSIADISKYVDKKIKIYERDLKR